MFISVFINMVEWKIINSVFNINFNVPLSLDKVAGVLALLSILLEI